MKATVALASLALGYQSEPNGQEEGNYRPVRHLLHPQSRKCPALFARDLRSPETNLGGGSRGSLVGNDAAELSEASGRG